jgi:hypothetical protein
MHHAEPQVSNVLLQLVQAGTIRTFEALKSAYRVMIMNTHPDAVGSELRLERYLRLSDHYREARACLGTVERNAEGASGGASAGASDNHRLEFFRQLHLIESLEMPYVFSAAQDREKLLCTKQRAMEELARWRTDLAALYDKADKEHAGIKAEKPMGPYLKHALALNIRPLVHNLIGFHLTGRELYATQARQNLSGIMHQLSEKGCFALRDFLTLLLEDMKHGAAALA